MEEQPDVEVSKSFLGNVFSLLKQTFQEWLQDKAPQLGAALAYYTVFSLAPLILVLLAIVGMIFRDDPAGAWDKITQQMSYFLDPSALQVVQNIAQKASQPGKSTIATIIGDRPRTFRRKWRVRPAARRAEYDLGRESKTRSRYLGISAEPISLIRDGRRDLFSAPRFTGAGSLLKGFSHYVQSVLPGGLLVAMSVYVIFDFAVIVLLFAMIFQVSA